MRRFNRWPKLQLLHDLRAVALSCKSALPRIAKFAEQDDISAVEAILISSLDNPCLGLPSDNRYEEAQRALLIAAYQVDEDTQASTFAIAFLLADVFNGQSGFGSMDQDWSDLNVFIRTLPAPRRVVFLRAYLRLHQQYIRILENPPLENEFEISSPEKIMGPLREIVRKMSKVEMTAISLADFGQDEKEHLEALKQVLGGPLCKFPEGDRWYPAEVIELIGHTPGTGAFEKCTALLIIDDIIHNVKWDQMRFRWSTNAPNYLMLSDSVREPILRGIRCIYETQAHEGWDPYFDWPDNKIEKSAVAIPYFDKY